MGNPHPGPGKSNPTLTAQNVENAILKFLLKIIELESQNFILVLDAGVCFNSRQGSSSQYKISFWILPSDTILDLRDGNAIQRFNPAEAIVGSMESRGRCSLGKSGWKCFDEAGQAVSLQY